MNEIVAGQPVWAWAAIAGGIALLLIVIVVTIIAVGARRKREEEDAARRRRQAQAVAPLQPAPLRPVPAGPVAAPVLAAPDRSKPVAAPPPAASLIVAPPTLTAQTNPQPASKDILKGDFSTGKLSDWVSLDGRPAPGRIINGWLRLGANEGVRSIASLPASAGQNFRCDFEVRQALAPTNGVPTNYFVGLTAMDVHGGVLNTWIDQEPVDNSTGTFRSMIESVMPEGAATVHISAHGPWSATAPTDGAVEFRSLEIRKVS